MPTLMLHSSLSSGRQWQALKRLIAGDCLTPDFSGYDGNGSTVKRPWSCAEETKELASWLAQQNEGSVVLIGHSYGGAAALHLARTQPDKIKALVLFEPVAFHLLKAATDHETCHLLKEVMDLSAQLPRLDPKQAAELFIDYWQHPAYFAALPLSLQEKMASQVWKVSADFDALINEDANLTQYQSSIRGPVLLLTGRQSRRSAQRIAELLAATLNNVRIQQIDTGHMGPVSDPDLVNPLIVQFLQDQALLT